jgi:GT2 family glycosyltransferase
MSRQPSISVVIPTRNRRRVLAETLAALDGQRSLAERFEVIVAVDGSSDDTLEWLGAARFSGFDLEILALDAGGPARARNRGVKRARARRVLFLGDDTSPEPETLAAHLEDGGDRELAVQGLIDWDPSQPVTEVMEYLAPEGPQFYFKGLEAGRDVPFSAVLGSNLSAPVEWLLTEPFDEEFTEACFEDTELAWRWRRRGWTTIFSPRARCLHRHRYDTIEPFLERQQRAGWWARKAVAAHPGMLSRVALQPIAFSVVSALRLVVRRRPRDHWDLQCRLAFARGFLFGRPA